MSNLFREYGSTSSIDIQGIPEQSFFEMLSQFHQERPDQRSSAPARLREFLRAPDSPPSAPLPSSLSPGHHGEDRGASKKDGADRVRKKSGGTESSLGTSSLFRKLRSSSRGELDGGKGETGEDGGVRGDPSYKPWVCTKSFVHYDAQSILFDLHEAAAQRGYSAQRRNTATGASAASVQSMSRSSAASVNEPIYSSIEDLTLSQDPGCVPTPTSGTDPMNGGPGAHGPHSPLLLCCPHFLNETGGHGERNISFLSSSAECRGGDSGDVTRGWLRRSNASVSVLEVPSEQSVTRLDRLKLYSIEHVDLGARYYRDCLHGKGNADTVACARYRLRILLLFSSKNTHKEFDLVEMVARRVRKLATCKTIKAVSWL